MCCVQGGRRQAQAQFEFSSSTASNNLHDDVVFPSISLTRSSLPPPRSVDPELTTPFTHRSSGSAPSFRPPQGVPGSSSSNTSSKSKSSSSSSSSKLSTPFICLKLGINGLLVLMVAADFSGTVLSIVGMQLCGSGLHTVVMSSIVCWAALLSFFLLQKRMTFLEIASLLLIMTGLLFSAAAQQHMGVVEAAKEVHGLEIKPKAGEGRKLYEAMLRGAADYLTPSASQPAEGSSIEGEAAAPGPLGQLFASASLDGRINNNRIQVNSNQLGLVNISNNSDSNNNTTSSVFPVDVGGVHHPQSYYAGAVGVHRVWLGMLITLSASWMFASNYVVAEGIQTFRNPPSSRYLCERIGLSCIIISTVYMVFYTLPNWESLVTVPVVESGGSEAVIFSGLFCIVIFHMLHTVSYFYLVRDAGAVTVGVLKACQAIGTYAVSAFAFCEKQESQCFTYERGMATVIVCFGVVLYSWSKTSRKRSRRMESSKASKVKHDIELTSIDT